MFINLCIFFICINFNGSQYTVFTALYAVQQHFCPNMAKCLKVCSHTCWLEPGTWVKFHFDCHFNTRKFKRNASPGWSTTACLREPACVCVSYITGVISGIDVMLSSLLYCTADGNLSKAKQRAGNAHQFERPLKLYKPSQLWKACCERAEANDLPCPINSQSTSASMLLSGRWLRERCWDKSTRDCVNIPLNSKTSWAWTGRGNPVCFSKPGQDQGVCLWGQITEQTKSN